MAFRKRQSRSRSRKQFRRGAMRVHGKNLPRTTLRGGIRL